MTEVNFYDKESKSGFFGQIGKELKSDFFFLLGGGGGGGGQLGLGYRVGVGK